MANEQAEPGVAGAPGDKSKETAAPVPAAGGSGTGEGTPEGKSTAPGVGATHEKKPEGTPTPMPAAGGAGGAGEKVVDLEEDQEPKFREGPPPFKERPIEQVRAQVARALVAILAVVIFFSFLTLWMIVPPPGLRDLEKILTIIFGPLIALVSGAVGYYFGGKSGGEG